MGQQAKKSGQINDDDEVYMANRSRNMWPCLLALRFSHVVVVVVVEVSTLHRIGDIDSSK